jgi:hypothetical protein
MMNKKTLAVLMIAFVMVLVIASPSFAQEGAETETFDNPELPGWERSPEAIVAEGVLQINGGNYAVPPGDWGDFDLSVRVRFTGEGEAVIGYHFRDQGRYILHLRSQVIALAREETEPFTELAVVEREQSQVGEWLEIRIVLSGGQHTIYLNDEQIIQVTDEQPLVAGPIFLHAAGNVTAEFDDFSISGVQAEFVPPPEGCGPPEGEPPQGEPEGEMQGEPEAVEGGPVPQATPEGGATSGDGTRSLLEDFLTGQASNLELSTFGINLLLAVITSYILSRIYVHWGTSLTNRRRFAANFMLMTLTTTFIIMVVRSSVALSLGLVGALSIVRFRAAVKEPEELTYLFLAVGLGIGLGDNQRMITMLTLAIAIVVLGLIRLLRKTQADVNLHLTFAASNPANLELESITGVLQEHCSKLKLLRFDENESTLETSFLVEFRDLDDLNSARRALQAMSPDVEISFLDNKGVW